MRLIVVIGYHAESRASKPFPVYAGRDTAEAEAAMEASNALVFEIIRNPTTVRKRRKTALPYSEPHPVVETAEEAATIEEEPVVEDTAAPASPADVAPAGGVSGKRGRAA